MRLIKPSFEIWESGTELNDILKHIEKCGRICYASLDKITDDSFQKFYKMIVNNGHLSVLEHGTVFLTYQGKFNDKMSEIIKRYNQNPYSKICWYTDKNNNIYIFVTTNLRVLIENRWGAINPVEYTPHHFKRVTVHITCDRGILSEITRHRHFSFSVQSTRYCNFSGNRFNNQLTFIIPQWCYPFIVPDTYIKNDEGKILSIIDDKNHIDYISYDNYSEQWLKTMYNAEQTYMNMVHCKIAPEKARDILPLSLATEIVMTGFIEDWKHFFDLRCAPEAHPQMREIAIPLRDEFIKRGYISRPENID